MTNKYDLKQTLMARDGLLEEEADDLIQEARDLISNGADPEEICQDLFGLEPDYIEELVHKMSLGL